MKKLSRQAFNEVKKAMDTYARPLEKFIFDEHFNNGSSINIVKELRKFQNEDGGFGHGIESDIRMPYSSPMATSVGVRHLSKLDNLTEAKEMIEKAIHYFEQSFNAERNGWFIASREINDYPHAPWWHFNVDIGMTIVDSNWGNPTAEILAYLYKYRQFVKTLDIDRLIDFALESMENKEEVNSENELFCYMKLYNILNGEVKERLKKSIERAIPQVIAYDSNKWDGYVPLPLDFATSSEAYNFDVDETSIGDNLDFFVNKLETNGKIEPPWGKSFYEGDLKPAYNEWIGVLTLKRLKTLDNYGRVEK